MTIKELKEKLPTMDSNERNEVLPTLMTMLSRVSRSTMMTFQNGWDYDGNPMPDGYNKFVNAQNKVILDCLKIEQSDIGLLVRNTLGLSALTDDTEVI